jgi:hypothetical protein
MIYHVLPGDAVLGTFRESSIEGEVVVFRDALISGPVRFDNPDDFWDARARFILTEYGEDEIQFHENVADEFERLADAGQDDEVNLWFEYELFCSVNMWFCLSRLKDSGAAIYRVEPAILSEADRWNGFGKIEAPGLEECFRLRQKFDDADLELGSRLWEAFTRGDGERLRTLGKQGTERFAYLDEVCEAAAEIDTRPREVLADIAADGEKEFAETFAEFSRRAGVYGFGDLQVQTILRSL